MSVRRLACLVIAVVVSVCLPACTSQESVSSSSGRSPSVTVPVLWAGQNSNGVEVGGVEPVVISVSNSSDPGFTVDLATIEAQGAGPSWRAASGVAATVATMISGRNPNTLSLGFTITGPIDGPSGGAAMTVGALAALKGVALLPEITMTGTISPDGTIGRVAGVSTKIKGAADAGYTSVMLPPDNMADRDPASGIGVVELGSRLGVEVLAVQDISAAFKAMTGTTIGPGVVDPMVLPGPSQSVVNSTTASLITRLSTEAQAALLPSASRTVIDERLASARSAKASGDVASAYGIAVDGYLVLQRVLAGQRTQEVILGKGVQAAYDDLLAEGSHIMAAANRALAANSDVTSMSADAQVQMPEALGWVTYALAIVQGLVDSRDSVPLDPEHVIEVAGVLAEQRAGVEVLFPDAVAVMKAESRPAGDATASANFLSNYTDFLVEAGSANAQYVAAVVPSSSNESVPGYAQAAVDVLARELAEIPVGTQSLADEIVESSNAMTYYVLTTSLITGRQVFGLHDFGVGSQVPQAQSPKALIASVDVGAQTVETYGSALSGAGRQVAYPIWSARWGRAVSDSLSGQPREVAGATIALEEIWYDAIACFMMTARPA